MTRRVLKDVSKLNVDTNPDSICVVGDSPNDAPMFNFFANAVGASNDIDFFDSLEARFGWVTDNPAGTSLAELAATFLRARK